MCLSVLEGGGRRRRRRRLSLLAKIEGEEAFIVKHRALESNTKSMRAASCCGIRLFAIYVGQESKEADVDVVVLDDD